MCDFERGLSCKPAGGRQVDGADGTQMQPSRFPAPAVDVFPRPRAGRQHAHAETAGMGIPDHEGTVCARLESPDKQIG
jgi:hypothetical protein